MSNPKPLIDIVWRADAFGEREIPPRPWMIEGCITAPSIGLLYAWRGSGKTLVAMDLALSVARGQPWLGYKVPRERTVLYVDGEMPLPDFRARLLAQSGPEGPPERLFILASEDLATEHRSINLAKEKDRLAIFNPYGDCLIRDLIKRTQEDVGLVIFDNWTTLVRGIDENDNSQMDPLKEWLILMRHYETSVLFVHHAGKSGGQRGGSAREDVIDYSIKLTGENGPEAFEWDKTRTGRPDPGEFGLRLEKWGEINKFLRVARHDESFKTGSKGPEPSHDKKVLDWLKENGSATGAEIAEALDLHRQSIARCLARLSQKDLVTRLADGKFCHG